ncbi:MAG: formylglycine-generating enzyme family protein, partial [Planktothrix sp.]
MAEEIIENRIVLTLYKRRGQYFTEHLGKGISLDMVLISHGKIIIGVPGDELPERFLQKTIPDIFNYFPPRQRDIMRMRDHGDNGPPITLEELSYIINYYPPFSRNKKAILSEFLRKKYPAIPVNIPQFFLGKYAITQAQWKVVAGYETIERKLKPEPSHFKGDNRPVEQVNWDDAREFCNRLSVKTGRTYRLPTEVEWEYACRAGTETPFHFGETISDELANYNATEIYGRGIKGKFRQETTDVGSFPPNNFGLYDMHGNVWEWCEDDWHD